MQNIDDNKVVASVILEQLGGHRFMVMTGVKNFYTNGNDLCMCLPRNASKANKLKITLRPDDTYDMEFFRFTSAHFRCNHKTGEATWVDDKRTQVRLFEGIYFDQLQELFTEVTGMYTHL